MRQFWFGRQRCGNWGDIFNVQLVTRLSGEAPERYDGPGKLLAVGSIIHRVREGDTVWGSGTLSPEHVPRPMPAGVRWCAVRGPLTRQLLLEAGAKDVPELYGDPALLVPYLYRAEVPIRFKLGILPHYKDHLALTHLAGKETCVISIRSGVEAVIRAAAACETIAASSLHGVVLGEALGKPTVWLRVDGCARLEGRDWKFRDYLAGTGRQPLSVDVATRGPLPALQWLPRPAVDLERLLAACPFNVGNKRLQDFEPVILR